MQVQIGPAFLCALGLVFGGYGVWELALAYRIKSLHDWVEKAALGAGSLTLCVLFASCSVRLFREIVKAVP